MRKTIDPYWIKRIVESGDNRAEGLHRLHRVVCDGLAQEKFDADDFSYKELAMVIGALDPFDEVGSAGRIAGEAVDMARVSPRSIFRESNPGLMTNAFQVITQELISSKVIAGYESNEEDWIADQLVETVPSKMLNQRIAGLTALDGPSEVAEGHPYSETGFSEKFVTTQEAKKGRILRISEELLLFDQTGEINRRARQLGYYTRQERERTIVRAVTDADAGSGKYVYRPKGAGTALYAVGNKNYIGSGGVTGFDAAVALVDWKSVEAAILYRSTQVKDDRVDGTPRAIHGLNSPSNILLVPEALRLTADYIATSTGGREETRSNATITERRNPVARYIGNVLSSPYVDEVSAADWYYGNPRKQFIWTEIWPVQTFSQGATSEAAFERDTIMAIKVRYFGGLSATDTVFFTKVDGN